MAPEDLAKWIEDNGLSQGEFAKRLKRASRKVRVDQSEVSRWTRRRRLPNADEKAAIEKVTGIPRGAWPSVENAHWSE
jgi:transcriptional regulator with XRE-family HTH domain